MSIRQKAWAIHQTLGRHTQIENQEEIEHSTYEHIQIILTLCSNFWSCESFLLPYYS